MTFAEDQDAVGELGTDGQDEAFGEAVRSRTSRWDLHGINAVSGRDSVERGGELAGGVIGQSTWKKSTASMVEAWAHRNRRQDVSVDRSGAGGIRRRLRILRIVDAPTQCPSLSSSPWMRW
jgi:hypothetical protein